MSQTIKQALDRVVSISEEHGFRTMPDTLTYMGENLEEFGEEDVRAYRLVMHSFRKLFAPKESANNEEFNDQA